jgi:DNA-binding transcriptional ArsR family regulator
MPTTLTLSRPAQIKALADPLRQRIMERLLVAPASAKAMADALGAKPTQLYHHFRVLETEGLITLAGRRRRRGAIEKLYRPAADKFVVSSALLGAAVDPVRSALGEALKRTIEDVAAFDLEALQSDDDPPIFLGRVVLQATEKRIREFQRFVERWTENCAADTDASAAPHALTVALYPLDGAPTKKRRR